VKGETQITLTSLPSVSPLQAHHARGKAWSLIFQYWETNRKATRPAPEPSSLDDTKESKNDGAATTKHTR
jgi:hypothetical protein